jgi:hypothetical protein
MIYIIIYFIGILVAFISLALTDAYNSKHEATITILHKPEMGFCLMSWLLVIVLIMILIVDWYINWNPKNPFYKE